MSLDQKLVSSQKLLWYLVFMLIYFICHHVNNNYVNGVPHFYFCLSFGPFLIWFRLVCRLKKQIGPFHSCQKSHSFRRSAAVRSCAWQRPLAKLALRLRCGNIIFFSLPELQLFLCFTLSLFYQYFIKPRNTTYL